MSSDEALRKALLEATNVVLHDESRKPRSAHQLVAGPVLGSSWEVDLQLYMKGAESSGTPPDVRSHRERLYSDLVSSPGSPQAWLAFLRHEENQAAAQTAPIDHALGNASRGQVSLLRLYHWATRAIPRLGNESDMSYLAVWLGFARHQGQRNEDDARDTFKTLKDCHIGENYAELYCEWAMFEHRCGNGDKAQDILAKALKIGAEPRSDIEALRDRLNQAGTGPEAAAAAWPVSAAAAQTPAADRRGASRPDPYGAAATPATARRPMRSAAAAAATPGIPSRPALGVGVGMKRTLGEREAAPAAPPAKPAEGGGSGGRKGGGGVPPRPKNALSSSLEALSDAGDGGARPPPASTSATAAATASSKQPGSGSAAIISPRLRSTTQPSQPQPALVRPSTAPATIAATSAAAEGPGPALTTFPTADVGPIMQPPDDDATYDFHRLALGRAALPSATAAAAAPDGPCPEDREGRAAASGSAMGPPPVPASALRSAAPPPSAAAMTPGAAAALDSAMKRAGGRRLGFTGLGGGPARRVVVPIPEEEGAGAVAEPQRAHAVVTLTAGNNGSGAATAPVGLAGPSDDSMMDVDTAGSPLPLKSSSLAPTRAEPQGPLPAQAPQQPQQQSLVAAPSRGALSSSTALPAAHTPLARPSAASGQAAPAPPPPAPAAHVAPSTAGRWPTVAPAATWAASPLVVRPSAVLEGLATGGRALAPSFLTSASDGARQQNSAAAANGEPAPHPQPQPVARTLAAPPAPAPPPASRPLASALATPGYPMSHTPGAAAPSTAARPSTGTRHPDPAAFTAGTTTATTSAGGSAAAAAAASQQQPYPRTATRQYPQTQQLATPAPQPQAPQPQPGHQQAAPGARHVGGVPPTAAQGAGPSAPAPATATNTTAGANTPAAGGGAGGADGRRRVPREDESYVIVRSVKYAKLECVGKGGSSKVFKVMAPNKKIYALKRIRYSGHDQEAAKGFLDEIGLLQSLRGKDNIIQLLDAEVVKAEGLIYMVLEYGETDLARLLAKQDRQRREEGLDGFDENFVRLYWQQMLKAVNAVHEMRIVHSDLKPANFLVVEGQLKLIDFGIAKAIHGDTTSIARESQVGTLNYMSPEAITGGGGSKVGRPSDVWSLGCILYQMVYGATPFAHLGFFQKMHAITDPKHEIAFPPVSNPHVVDALRLCLDRNSKTRATLQDLLDHVFLHPSKAAAQAAPPAAPAFTAEQLKGLLAQAGVAGNLDRAAETLMAQLMGGAASLGDLGPLMQRGGAGGQGGTTG